MGSTPSCLHRRSDLAGLRTRANYPYTFHRVDNSVRGIIPVAFDLGKLSLRLWSTRQALRLHVVLPVQPFFAVTTTAQLYSVLELDFFRVQTKPLVRRLTSVGSSLGVAPY